MEEENTRQNKVETAFERAYERMKPKSTGPTDEEIIEYFGI